MKWFKDTTEDGREFHFSLRDDLFFIIQRIDDVAGHYWEGRCSADRRYFLGRSLRGMKRWAENYRSGD